MAEPSTPLPASTVILVRPDGAEGFEIFMNRRPEQMDTYAGVYVFPGGRVEVTDYSPEMVGLTRGLTIEQAWQKLGGELDPALCFGHWVAAVRELFEEAGIYFFMPHDGVGESDGSDFLSQRLADQRTSLQSGLIDLPSLLFNEQLRCDLAQLSYFYHRVTPEHYRVRFDTRFFLAALPAQQTPLHSSEEVTESLWISANEALERSLAGTFPIMPPTVAVLRNLSSYRSWSALSEAFRLR
jgi:8-oxo-dGTP pyrophosphatase MutT (NUDIX family)